MATSEALSTYAFSTKTETQEVPDVIKVESVETPEPKMEPIEVQVLETEKLNVYQVEARIQIEKNTGFSCLMVIDRTEETVLHELKDGNSIKRVTWKEVTTLTQDLDKIDSEWLIKLNRKVFVTSNLDKNGEPTETHRECVEFVDRNLENELIKKLMGVALAEAIIDENRKSQIESENQKSGFMSFVKNNPLTRKIMRSLKSSSDQEQIEEGKTSKENEYVELPNGENDKTIDDEVFIENEKSSDEKSTGKSVTKSVAKSVAKSTGKSSNNSAHESIEKSDEKSIANSDSKSSHKSEAKSEKSKFDVKQVESEPESPNSENVYESLSDEEEASSLNVEVGELPEHTPGTKSVSDSGFESGTKSEASLKTNPKVLDDRSDAKSDKKETDAESESPKADEMALAENNEIDENSSKSPSEFEIVQFEPENKVLKGGKSKSGSQSDPTHTKPKSKRPRKVEVLQVDITEIRMEKDLDGTK